MKIGILRETKDPPDRRVPLIPCQCGELKETYPGLEILVQPSTLRCFSDQEYADAGLTLREDLSECEVLMGVKEVDPSALLAGKTFLFFSHTAKEQPYNRGLLQEVIRKKVRLIDYEYLTDGSGQRVVAFGRWAGIVGAYNGLRAYGMRTGRFRLQPASGYRDLAELKSRLEGIDAGKMRIVITGGGRVAAGAMEILDAAGVRRVDPQEYTDTDFDDAVYSQLDPWHYTFRRDGSEFDFGHFVTHPEMYGNSFLPFAGRSDIYMACHFWDPKAPVLLSREDLQKRARSLKVIADISCDLDGPIASTLRASTIGDPFYGYDPKTGTETAPFAAGAITVMAVDNLPGELPRDSSADFGRALMEQVVPELTGERDTGMLARACIAGDGRLTDGFAYLQDYLEGTG